MTKTGVFATKKEIESLKIAVAMSGTMIHIRRKGPAELCHDLALEHGLPEIQGFYGLDGDGEFVTS